MTFDDYFVAFEGAHRRGDRDAMIAIIKRVPDTETDAFLERLEAEGLGSKRIPESDRSQLAGSLRAAGIPVREASSLSILISGTFADYVRDRMDARQVDADSILRRIDEDDVGEVSFDEADEQHVRAWIAAVLDGDDDPEMGLPDGAEEILAAALDASPRSILALKERN